MKASAKRMIIILGPPAPDPLTGETFTAPLVATVIAEAERQVKRADALDRLLPQGQLPPCRMTDQRAGLQGDDRAVTGIFLRQMAQNVGSQGRAAFDPHPNRRRRLAQCRR